jgi:hypothetical protein
VTFAWPLQSRLADPRPTSHNPIGVTIPAADPKVQATTAVQLVAVLQILARGSLLVVICRADRRRSVMPATTCTAANRATTVLQPATIDRRHIDSDIVRRNDVRHSLCAHHLALWRFLEVVSMVKVGIPELWCNDTQAWQTFC